MIRVKVNADKLFDDLSQGIVKRYKRNIYDNIHRATNYYEQAIKKGVYSDILVKTHKISPVTEETLAVQKSSGHPTLYHTGRMVNSIKTRVSPLRHGIKINVGYAKSEYAKWVKLHAKGFPLYLSDNPVTNPNKVSPPRPFFALLTEMYKLDRRMISAISKVPLK